MRRLTVALNLTVTVSFSVSETNHWFGDGEEEGEVDCQGHGQAVPRKQAT